MSRHSDQGDTDHDVNGMVFGLLDEADGLQKHIDDCKAKVDRLECAHAQAKQKLSEYEQQLQKNRAALSRVREQHKQLRSLASSVPDADLSAALPRPTRTHIKAPQTNVSAYAKQDAKNPPTHVRPGLIENPEWRPAAPQETMVFARDQRVYRSFTYLSSKYTNITLIENKWQEMFCHFCGANTPMYAEDGDFFRLDTLKQHMNSSHRGEVRICYPHGIDDSKLVTMFHVLSREELLRVRSGKWTIKSVRIPNQIRERRPRLPGLDDMDDEDVPHEIKGSENMAEELSRQSVRSEPRETRTDHAVNEVSEAEVFAAAAATSDHAAEENGSGTGTHRGRSSLGTFSTLDVSDGYVDRANGHYPPLYKRPLSLMVLVARHLRPPTTSAQRTSVNVCEHGQDKPSPSAD